MNPLPPPDPRIPIKSNIPEIKTVTIKNREITVEYDRTLKAQYHLEFMKVRSQNRSFKYRLFLSIFL